MRSRLSAGLVLIALFSSGLYSSASAAEPLQPAAVPSLAKAKPAVYDGSQFLLRNSLTTGVANSTFAFGPTGGTHSWVTGTETESKLQAST